MSPGTYGNLPGEKGSGDPNIMKLGDGANKVRPLDNVVAGWIQHGIEHPSDPEKFASVVCPGPRTCPLDRKPVGPDGETQYFPRSRRYAANVWDYNTGSVKVLIAGPAVFNELKTAADVGIDPASCDWTIIKEGSGLSTKYKVIRHDVGPHGLAVEPGMLHDVAKYEQTTSPEAIFEMLENFGIDYDALEVPSYTLDEALAYAIPFGKHKGLTVDQLVSKELDYAQWLHGSRLESGQLGDPTFLALQTVMEDRGFVASLEDALDQLPDPVLPAATTAPAAEPAAAAVDLDNPPPHELPGTPPEGWTRLKAPNGIVADFPDQAVSGLLTTGFVVVEPEPEPEPATAVDANAPMMVEIGGQAVELPREQALALIATGTAKEVTDGGTEPEPPKLPLPDEVVQINVGGTVVPMPYVQAKDIVDNASANAHFEDEDVQAAHEAANARGREAEANSPGETPRPEPASTSGRQHDPEKPFECGQCDWAGKTQGSLTQHMNKEHKGAVPQPSAVPAASNGDGNIDEELKALISGSPIARDYKQLLGIFAEETGTENFAEMTTEQKLKLKVRLEAEIKAMA